MNMADRLSPHLTLAEFTESDTAARLGIDNSLPGNLFEAAKTVGLMLERIRAVLGAPMLISSGYRCSVLNKAIGSGPSSDHPKAQALDFRAPGYGTPLEICQTLLPRMTELGIGQLIYEYTWVHVSVRSPKNPANTVLTLLRTGYVVGVG
jgi:zinc D-Ala-D-Ala carboxypeptidase